MKAGDIGQKQAAEQADWRKCGMGWAVIRPEPVVDVSRQIGSSTPEASVRFFPTHAARRRSRAPRFHLEKSPL
jgi:hypothetical protein